MTMIIALSVLLIAAIWLLLKWASAPSTVTLEEEADKISELKDKEKVLEAKEKRLKYEAEVKDKEASVNQLEKEISDED